MIRDLILLMSCRVGKSKTICPSEVARTIDPDHWRELMEEIREVARGMHENHEIDITQKGQRVKSFDLKGPIRLRIK